MVETAIVWLGKIRPTRFLVAVLIACGMSALFSSCSSVSLLSVPSFDISRIVPEQKSNGYILKIEAVRQIGNVQAWIGEDDWLYITIPDTSIDFNRMNELKKSPLIRSTQIFRYESSVQVTLQLNGKFHDVQVLRYPGDNNIYVVLYQLNTDQ
ncbi:MAG: hypothetical protein M1469_11155 [Bacteroidetes bacterium]|nr:hypothetical protein [Bacteroidota bacterium]